MKDITIWQPILLIAITLFIGLVLGALYTYRKLKFESDLLEIDLDIMTEKVHKLEKLQIEYKLATTEIFILKERIAKMIEKYEEKKTK